MLASPARRSASPTCAMRIMRAGGIAMAPAFGQPELQRWHWKQRYAFSPRTDCRRAARSPSGVRPTSPS